MVRVNYPAVNYIKLAENLGSAGGYYEGIKRAAESSDFIYTLDDDVCLKPDTLFEIAKGFVRLTTRPVEGRKGSRHASSCLQRACKLVKRRVGSI